MCDPTALAIGNLALKVGGEVAGAIGQGKEAKANVAAANRAFGDTLADLAARSSEETRLAAEKIARNRVVAKATSSTATASAAEAGVAGTSVGLLLGDIERQRGEASETVRANLEITQAQLDRQRRAAETARQNRIAGGPQAPNLFATGLRIAAPAISFATQLIGRKPVGSEEGG